MVAGLVAGLIGRTWTDKHGTTRPLTAADILVVAPYNAHVAEIHAAIEHRLGDPIRVGTVDKFQGQEAPVSIFSTATSSPDELPRDMEFLYSGNRLNVAVSRARGAGGRRVQPRPADRGLPDRRADEARQRLLPARRGRRRAGH